MRKLMLLLLAALLPACATVTSGTSQNMSVITEPPGATCQLQRDGAVVAVVNPTPGSARISKSTRAIAINCTRPGSVATSQTVPSEFQAMTAGNILIGGVIGVAVDAASGAMNKYPESVRIILPPESFASDAERGAYFTARAGEAREAFAERIRQVDLTCGTVGREICAGRVSALEAERDAELARLEALRLSARPA